MACTHVWTCKGLQRAQVGEGDFFWDANGRNQFPKVAEDADAQLQKYKQVRVRLCSSQCHCLLKPISRMALAMPSCTGRGSRARSS